MVVRQIVVDHIAKKKREILYNFKERMNSKYNPLPQNLEEFDVCLNTLQTFIYDIHYEHPREYDHYESKPIYCYFVYGKLMTLTYHNRSDETSGFALEGIDNLTDIYEELEGGPNCGFKYVKSFTF